MIQTGTNLVKSQKQSLVAENITKYLNGLSASGVIIYDKAQYLAL